MLLWARRYSRDALTIKELYSPQALQTVEGLDVLCGILRRPKTHAISVEQVKDEVRRGSQILLLLLETATMSLHEPSFYLPNWNAVFHLFGTVTKMRLERSVKLQSYLGLSEEQMYDIIWQETKEMLLRAEQIGPPR